MMPVCTCGHTTLDHFLAWSHCELCACAYFLWEGDE